MVHAARFCFFFFRVEVGVEKRVSVFERSIHRKPVFLSLSSSLSLSIYIFRKPNKRTLEFRAVSFFKKEDI